MLQLEARGFSIALAAQLILLLSLLSVSLAEEGGYGEFTAELRGRELIVGSTCKGSCSGVADTGRASCEIHPGTVSALVSLTACVQASPYTLPADDIDSEDSAAVFSTSETLVTHLGGHENCTGNAGCHWTVELAEHFLESSCIDVHVADFTTAVPPLRGISQRIWMPTYVHEEGEEYSHGSNITELPQCLENTELFQWSAIRSESCSGNIRGFSPTHVYSVSTTETFVTANSSILYSPCRGCVWYQLLLPISSNIISFTLINIFYALLATSQSGVSEVWLGVAGVSPLLRVYPSPTLEWVWTGDDTLTSFLASASLALDSQGHLVAVNGEGEELQLPVSLLLSHALYNSFPTTSNESNLISSLHLSSNEDALSLEDRPHPLLRFHQTSLICPLTRVLVEAPICDRVTRSVVEIERTGFLESVDHESLPWVNCGVMSDALPTDVFLRPGESYVFTVHLFLNPLLAGDIIDVDELQVVSTLSRPDTVEVVTQGTFHPSNSTVMYLVSLWERTESRAQIQVPPATILRSVDVHFQVRGVGMECVDPLNPRPQLLGRLQTRVHVGCPPGLSLVFDHVATQARDNQFCTTTTNNISCYYFGNEFRPEMKLVDAVTGERSTYTGPYTLRVLAGGISTSDMQGFSPNVQSQIWTVSADDVISHDSNKIEWTCGLSSPCGEVLPGSRGSPEYYLLIQASNREVGQADTYCDLTVEFTVRVHGMSMGPITTFVTIIVLLVVLVVPLVTLFLVWVWRERRGEGRVPEGEEEGEWVGEKWYKKWVDRGRVLADGLWLRMKELGEGYRKTRRPLEPHLHKE